MRDGVGKRQVSSLLVCAWILSLAPAPATSQQAQVFEGYIAGKVYERDGTTPLKDTVVTATQITTNQRLLSAPSDARGNFVIRNAQPGIYAFTLTYKGREYRVAERLDARVRMVSPDGTEVPARMTFLLEVCFRKDKDDARDKTALVVRGECKSELPAFLAALVQEKSHRGLLLLIAGGAVAGTTLGILAATGGNEASAVTR